MYPGQRPHDIYQTPKLASSISHVYGKTDDLAMCEIFGGYNQALTYPQMKWLCDQHQLRGVNFMIPHSFNPRAPYDKDYPPYFYNDGFEPRYPLYRVWADYSSRLSLMLTGGRHVCPIALLFSGNTKHVGKLITPEDMTSAIQDALYDCDWLPFEVFENDTSLSGNEIKLHKERYQVLIVPPAEVIPYATLEKVKRFYEKGGIVVGYGFLPSKSATIGKTSADIASLVSSIWNNPSAPGTAVCRHNSKGGRSFLLAEKPTPSDISKILEEEAGIPPVLKVLEGETDNWLHVLHRVKEGRDVFLICNQNHEGSARKFRLQAIAEGTPEIWDAMRNEINSIAYKRDNDKVEFELTLEPDESVMVVFRSRKRDLPVRLEAASKPVQEIAVTRDNKPANPDPTPTQQTKLTISPVKSDIFHGQCDIPASVDLAKSRIYIELDELVPEAAASISVNGQHAGGFIDKPFRLNITRHLKAGQNSIQIKPFAPKSAKLVIY